MPHECVLLPSSSKAFTSAASGADKRINQLDTAFKRANVTKIIGEKDYSDCNPKKLEEEVMALIQPKYRGVFN